MTKLRNRPKLNFHTLIVRPGDDFHPQDWRDRPKNYQVIEYGGAEQFRGRADAWRFMFNRKQMQQDRFDRWAIVCERLAPLQNQGSQ